MLSELVCGCVKMHSAIILYFSAKIRQELVRGCSKTQGHNSVFLLPLAVEAATFHGVRGHGA